MKIADQPRLSRRLSLLTLTLYGLGVTVGAGIYVLIGEVAGRAGMMAPWSFLVAAIVTCFSALSFAELVVRFPESAGEAVYVENGFRRRSLALATGLAVALTGTVSAATVSLGTAAYLAEIIAVPQAIGAVLVIVILAILAARGMAKSVIAAGLMTLVEIGGLALVAGGALYADPQILARIGEIAPPMQLAGLSVIASGGLLAFFAFIGFEDMVNVVEEVRRPAHTMPRAIILTLIITTLLYVGVTTIAVLAIGPTALASTSAPLAKLAAFGNTISPRALSLIAVIAGINGVLIQIIMASRVLYGLAHRGQLPAWFAAVSPSRHTPMRATFFVAAAIGVLAVLVPLGRLAAVTSLVTLLVFTMVNLALVAIKRRAPSTAGFTVPIAVPVMGALLAVGLLLVEVLQRGG